MDTSEKILKLKKLVLAIKKLFNSEFTFTVSISKLKIFLISLIFVSKNICLVLSTSAFQGFMYFFFSLK